MTAWLERVRCAFDPKCLIERGLKKDGCEVVMTDAPRPRLVVDFDKPCSPVDRNAARCDYLVIAEDPQGFGWVAPLELKRGRLDVDEVVKQLQAGACAVKDRVPKDVPVKFVPVAVTGSVSKDAHNKLRDKRNRIRFHGHMVRVRRISCGAPLVEVLRP